MAALPIPFSFTGNRLETNTGVQNKPTPSTGPLATRRSYSPVPSATLSSLSSALSSSGSLQSHEVSKLVLGTAEVPEYSSSSSEGETTADSYSRSGKSSSRLNDVRRPTSDRRKARAHKRSRFSPQVQFSRTSDSEKLTALDPKATETLPERDVSKYTLGGSCNTIKEYQADQGAIFSKGWQNLKTLDAPLTGIENMIFSALGRTGINSNAAGIIANHIISTILTAGVVGLGIGVGLFVVVCIFAGWLIDLGASAAIGLALRLFQGLALVLPMICNNETSAKVADFFNKTCNAYFDTKMGKFSGIPYLFNKLANRAVQWHIGKGNESYAEHYEKCAYDKATNKLVKEGLKKLEQLDADEIREAATPRFIEVVKEESNSKAVDASTAGVEHLVRHTIELNRQEKHDGNVALANGIRTSRDAEFIWIRNDNRTADKAQSLLKNAVEEDSDLLIGESVYCEETSSSSSSSATSLPLSDSEDSEAGGIAIAPATADQVAAAQAAATTAPQAPVAETAATTNGFWGRFRSRLFGRTAPAPVSERPTIGAPRELRRILHDATGARVYGQPLSLAEIQERFHPDEHSKNLRNRIAEGTAQGQDSYHSGSYYSYSTSSGEESSSSSRLVDPAIATGDDTYAASDSQRPPTDRLRYNPSSHSDSSAQGGWGVKNDRADELSSLSSSQLSVSSASSRGDDFEQKKADRAVAFEIAKAEYSKKLALAREAELNKRRPLEELIKMSKELDLRTAQILADNAESQAEVERLLNPPKRTFADVVAGR